MHGGNFRCSLIIDKNMGSIEFDSKVNAMYIRMKKGKVDKSEPLADNVIMDVDIKKICCSESLF